METELRLGDSKEKTCSAWLNGWVQATRRPGIFQASGSLLFRIKRFRYRHCLVILAILVSYPCMAVSEQTGKQIEDKPTISGDDFEIKIEIIQQQTPMLMPDALARIRKYESKVAFNDSCFKANEVKVVRKKVEQVRFTFPSSLLNGDTFFFTPGKYPVSGAIEYHAEEMKAPTQLAYKPEPISIVPPQTALLRGGVLGAFLLSLFLTVYRLRYQFHTDGTKILSWPVLFGFALDGFLLFIFGSVSACITILLIQRIGQGNLPVSVDVKDYLGGIIVGLFSAKFGDYWYTQFFKESPQSTADSNEAEKSSSD